LALCGLLAYSGLFPGHIVSQLVTGLAEHGFVVGAIAGCHDEGGTTKPQPTNGAKKHCPFCTGYASFQFGCRPAYTVLPPQAVGGDVPAIEDDMAPARAPSPAEPRPTLSQSRS
jgi:hypothetical protein